MKHYDSVEVGKRIKDIRKKAGIKQIKLAEERLAETKTIISTTRRLLRETIADKDKFYSKVRTLRKREQLAHSATT